MPEFDKKQYWKNRKAGKRGQGERPDTKHITVLTESGPMRISVRELVEMRSKQNA